MAKEKHATYSKFCRMLLKEELGRRFDGDALDTLLKFSTDENSMVLLATIAETLLPIAPLLQVLNDALQAHASRALESWLAAIHHEFDKRMAQMELRHGPCPSQDLRVVLRSEYVSGNLGDWYFAAYMHNGGTAICGWLKPPHKSSAVRKDWDRWMRRKPPAKK